MIGHEIDASKDLNLHSYIKRKGYIARLFVQYIYKCVCTFVCMVGWLMSMENLEQKCNELFSLKQELEDNKIQYKVLNTEVEKKTKEIQILMEIAKIRGEEFEDYEESKEIINTKNDIERLQKTINDIETNILEDLKNITFDIPIEIPKLDINNISVINFVKGPYNGIIKYISSILNTDIPIKIDRILLHPDKIIVTNIEDVIQIIDNLKILKNNIGRIAKILLNEEDKDVEDATNYIYTSAYKDIWELINGRKIMSIRMFF